MTTELQQRVEWAEKREAGLISHVQRLENAKRAMAAELQATTAALSQVLTERADADTCVKLHLIVREDHSDMVQQLRQQLQDAQQDAANDCLKREASEKSRLEAEAGLADSGETIRALRERADRADRHTERLHAELKAQREAAEFLRAEGEGLLCNQRAAQEAAVRDLQDLLEEAQAATEVAHRSAHSQGMDAEAQMHALQSGLAATQADLAAALADQKEAAEISAQLEVCRGELDRSQEDLRGSLRKQLQLQRESQERLELLSHAEGEVGELRAALRDTQKDVELARPALHKAQEHAQGGDRIREQLEDDKQQLVVRLTDAQKASQEASGMAQARAAQLQEAQCQVKDWEQRCSLLKQQCQEAQQRLQEEADKRVGAEGLVEQLKGALKESQVQNQQLQHTQQCLGSAERRASFCEKKVERLNGELASVKQQLWQAQESSARAGERAEQQSAELSDKRAEREVLQCRLQAQAADLADKDSRLCELAQDVVSLGADLESRDSQLRDAAAMLSAKGQQCLELDLQLDAVRAQLRARAAEASGLEAACQVRRPTAR